MSRFYLRLAILLLPLFTLLAVTMSALGSTQPIHPALRGFVEGCEGVPQPCWYGITFLTQAEQDNLSLEDLGFQVSNVEFDNHYSMFDYTSPSPEVCDVSLFYEYDNGKYIDLDDCPAIPLHEIITLLGEPENFGVNEQGNRITLRFQTHFFIRFHIPSINTVISPLNDTRAIGIDPWRLQGGAWITWRGFMTLARYCLIEPFLQEMLYNC